LLLCSSSGEHTDRLVCGQWFFEMLNQWLWPGAGFISAKTPQGGA